MKVIFFAALKEQLATAELELTTEQVSSINSIVQLKHYLIGQNPAWQPHLDKPSILCAVNQAMVNNPEHSLKYGDEVAFFPPVTGG